MTAHDYRSLKILAKERRCSVKDLFALSPQNDPYYCGSETDIADGDWFAGLWEQFEFPDGVHLRRIHYRLISHDEPVQKRNGATYENTLECWKALGEASKRARYLDLVPASSFVDRRNPPPTLFTPTEAESLSIVLDDTEVEDTANLPEFPDLPHYSLYGPVVHQRYHLEIWCEKSTVNDVLEPLCRQFSANLVTGVGEMSITSVLDLLQRAARRDRPARILYVSDFDPAGKSMPVAVARKAEFYIERECLGIDLRIFPAVLTEEQVQQYRLPRIPIKESERRRGRFEERFGAGATELDALEALRPGELRRILRAELQRYFDPALSSKAMEARSAIRNELRTLEADLAADFTDQIDQLRGEYAEIRENLTAWQERAGTIWHGITERLDQARPDAEGFLLPEPVEADERDDALFDSERGYLDQLDAYKRFQGKYAGDGS